MSPSFCPRDGLRVTCLTLLLSTVSLGSDFVVRPVTYSGQPIASSAVPLAVLGEQLLLTAYNNGEHGIYRTDGRQVQLIDDTVVVPLSRFPNQGYEVIEFRDELYFSGIGPDGNELYATNGQSIRQVANIAPGNLSANPKDFRVINQNLIFTGITEDQSTGAAPLKQFHTDGEIVEVFDLTMFLSRGAAQVADRLVFSGLPTGGNASSAYSTNGDSLTAIVAVGGEDLSGPTKFTEFGGNVYFEAGPLSNSGIYRTKDGKVAEFVAKVQDFSSHNFASGIFDFQENLYIKVDDMVMRETAIYQSNESVPSEVLNWQWPAGILQTSTFEQQPIYVHDDRAFFTYRSGLDRVLYSFDGDVFEQIEFDESYREFEFTSLGNRKFLNARGSFESLALYELIDGNVVHLGPGLDSMAIFQGELFGINNRLPGVFEPTTLFRTENGRLISMGEYGPRLSPFDEVRFVEFDGQLYFRGAIGNQPQLFAIMPVPEPAALTLLAACLLGCSQNRRRCRHRGIGGKS